MLLERDYSKTCVRNSTGENMGHRISNGHSSRKTATGEGEISRERSNNGGEKGGTAIEEDGEWGNDQPLVPERNGERRNG
jgi:hypothetical protein